MQSGQTKYGIGMTVSACLWLGLFPLLQFGSFHTITHDKWICMLVLTGLTLAGFLADAVMRRLSRPRLLPLLFCGGLLLWTVLSCLFSPYPGSPWWLGTGRREGLATQLCYLALFFLFSFSKVCKKTVLTAAGYGFLVFFAVVLIQRAGGNPFGLYPEGSGYEFAPDFQGTIGNVDMCSAYLVILCGLFLPELVDSFRFQATQPRSVRSPQSGRIPSSVHTKSSVLDRTPQSGTVPSHKIKIVSFLYPCFLLFSLAAAVYLLFTIHVFSGQLALAVLVAVVLVRLLPKKARLPVLVLLLAAVLLLVWFWPGEEGTEIWELHEILQGRPRYAFGSGRLGVLARTRTMLQTEGRLLLGTGADTFAKRFNAFLITYEMAHPDEPYLDGYYDSPHCEYLALISNCGIPALLCFLALIICCCLGRSPWCDTALAFSVQLLFSFSVCLVAPMFWVVLGLSVGRAGTFPALFPSDRSKSKAVPTSSL